MWPTLHYSVDLQIQTYTEPVPLEYEKLATKYSWICGYFYSVAIKAMFCEEKDVVGVSNLPCRAENQCRHWLIDVTLVWQQCD